MYVELHETHRDQLKRERVLALEGDHFRTVLELDETADEKGRAVLIARLSDLERRIDVHVRPQATEPEDEPVLEAKPVQNKDEMAAADSAP